MKKLLISFCMLLLLVVPSFASQLDPAFVDKEIQSLIDMDEVNRNTWYFAEVIGPRQAGAPAELRGAEKMAERFRSYGIKDVRVDKLGRSTTGALGSLNTLPELVINNFVDKTAAVFGLPTTFNKGISVGRGNTNNANTRTGPDGVTGTIFYAGFGATVQDFEGMQPGNIALIDTTIRSMTTPSGTLLTELRNAYARAVSAGAAAVLFIAYEPAPRVPGSPHHLQEVGFVATGPATGWASPGTTGTPGWSNFAITDATVPYGTVTDYAAEDLLAWPNTVVTYTVGQYDSLYNVVATIPPSIPNPDAGIIVFISHLDTYTACPGANDNGTGMAAVTEMARVFQILANQGKLDLEVVFISAVSEENGLHGSTQIANARPNTGFDVERRNRIVAVYNYDMVAPADPYNAGMTLSLRQHFNTTTAPREDDIVAVNSLAAAERFGLPIVPIAERNTTGGYAIKLTNGGGSDHAPFGALRVAGVFPNGIPNANHSFRGTLNYPASAPAPSGGWNATVPLEARYHTTGDTFWYNYCPERMEIALKISGASSYAIARVAPPFFVEVFAEVEKLNGNKNNLTITVLEEYERGVWEVTKTFSIDNNAAGTYQVGDHKVYVDTKGNTQIRECYIVESAAIPPAVSLVSVTPSAVLQSLSGNNNSLTITVVEKFDDDKTTETKQTFSVANNTDSTYSVGVHKVYVSIKGNSIREVTLK